MGIGGNFWDLLKPYARPEGFDFLRNKRVAVDLSYWIVQHETAIKGYARNPHLRLTFFRTINLFSKFGAYPVFVVDGTPSPLKSQARAARFFRSSGIDSSSLPAEEEGLSVKRNHRFVKYVEECVELLELHGMPVLKAKAEAEALCAQLNREGVVDACITTDSDAFLYGAQCIIKSIQINSKEPFECYHISDIEAGLGLARNHLIAISLLVGNDHDPNGVTGIGIDTALRFVKRFSQDEILQRLHEIGKEDAVVIQGSIVSDVLQSTDENSPKKSSHCSHCGHPGSKRTHLKFSCEYCGSTAGQSCNLKIVGFKCDCPSCDLDKKERERRKNENWQINVCKKISLEENFPNDEIIQMYLKNHHGIDDDPCIGWASPKTEMLVDYLTYQQHWEPSYIRQRMLPMLSTIYLRDMASRPSNDLLYGQYEFHSIQRVKIRYGHQFYVVKWKKAANALSDESYVIPVEPDIQEESREPDDESIDVLEEPEEPLVCIDKEGCFLSTDEDMELVRNAFPDKVEQFLKEKELKEAKSRKKKSGSQSDVTPENSGVSKSVQLSITEFYRASKARCQKNTDENAEDVDGSPEVKRKEKSTRLSKSVRRRLLFD